MPQALKDRDNLGFNPQYLVLLDSTARESLWNLVRHATTSSLLPFLDQTSGPWISIHQSCSVPMQSAVLSYI